MSFCYGPIVLPGLGQITSTTISQQSSSLIIENQSLFDVLFSVQVAQPQALTQAQVNAIVNAGGSITTGGWDLHIGPRNFGVLELNAGDLTQSPAGGYWSGTVWILQASLPNVQTTAGSFVSDPGPNIWITAYGPGEKLPDPGIASLGYFLASQERQVSVPVTPVFQALVNQITATAAFTWLQFAGPFPIGNFPFSNAATTAGIATPGQFFILMYSLLATMVNLSGVAGTAESQSVQIRIACLDSTSALVGSALLFNDYFAHQALQSRSETVHNPANPQAVPLTVVAGAGPPYSLSAQIQVFGMSGGGGTNIKAMDINMFFDITPLIVPGPSGGLAGTLQGQTYKGFVY